MSGSSNSSNNSIASGSSSSSGISNNSNNSMDSIQSNTASNHFTLMSNGRSINILCNDIKQEPEEDISHHHQSQPTKGISFARLNTSRSRTNSYSSLDNESATSSLMSSDDERPSTTTKKSKKVHLCTICNKTFTTSGHLSRHHRIHSGEKNYRCPLWPECQSRFSRQDNCMQHFRTHNTANSRRYGGQLNQMGQINSINNNINNISNLNGMSSVNGLNSIGLPYNQPSQFSQSATQQDADERLRSFAALASAVERE